MRMSFGGMLPETVSPLVLQAQLAGIPGFTIRPTISMLIPRLFLTKPLVEQPFRSRRPSPNL